MSKLCIAHLDELQERIERSTGEKPTKVSLKRVLTSLGAGSLSALFNGREAAQQLGRSESWVKKTALKPGDRASASNRWGGAVGVYAGRSGRAKKARKRYEAR